MKLTLNEWQKLKKDEKKLIVQASFKDGSDSWQPFTIGMSWQYGLLDFENLSNKYQIGDHNKLIFCAIKYDTDQRRRGFSPVNRKIILENLEKNGIKNILLNHNEYFTSLPTYKYVISPEGNGIDCHRHYEALLAGCIPIMEKNPLTEHKYTNLPILWTNDYSEINNEYLENKYLEMLDKEYDFSSLFLNNYDSNIQNYIKDCGNFWIYNCTGQLYYK